MDYTPMHTYDYKLAFCQATRELPEDLQRIIWNKTNKYEPICPGAPKKLRRTSSLPIERLDTLVKNWREKWGEP
jgi:hypothetical protein